MYMFLERNTCIHMYLSLERNTCIHGYLSFVQGYMYIHMFQG
jgi:hypothetical protein